MSRLWSVEDSSDDAASKASRLDQLVLRFTVGDDPHWDARLVDYDIRASLAHARMLGERGYLSPDDFAALDKAFAELAHEFAQGERTIRMADEDVHTALEIGLTEKLGDLGKRIHLGRSRNDQVLAALRLYLVDVVEQMVAATDRVIGSIDGLIAEQGAMPLPGYTHLQRAMPSSVALWAGAYASELADDREGVRACRRRLLRNPLGSAAGYGVPVVEIDRRRTTELLAFEETQEPVTAVQLSRGKAEAQLLFELTLLVQDLGRMASDLCLFAGQEYGFVRLPNAFTTGSSIMPQKRNPDLFELVRGRAAMASGELVAVLGLTSKMPSGYHRDFQLIKAPLFRSIDAVADCLAVMEHALPGIEFTDRAREAAQDPTLRATEEAYRLVVDRGLPFRDAYREVARRFKKPD